ncbi:ribosomal protein L10 [Wuchereria bancrofti]|uniref:Ribosomal protein L10 n=1 Tax=Wuchereria bancrofti TaxID=6293 RepID=J9FB64_WUCBA|nr:ribosomal protein L10 [Wuchereria bancrofti]
MAIALGKTSSTEYARGLNKISGLLKGECGLMFTNEDHDSVKKYFNEMYMSDFARCGQTAISTVELCEGPLTQFPFSLEPQLRKLGLPTKLEKGVVTLISHYVICKDGDKLTADQCSSRNIRASVSGDDMRSLSTILKKVLRRKNTKPPISNGPSTTTTITIQKQPQTAFVPTSNTFVTSCLYMPIDFIVFLREKMKSSDIDNNLINEISRHTENLKFSESKAYFGIDKRKPLDEVTVVASQSYLEVCNSAAHKRKVTASFLSSFAVVCFYFWYSRKDYDGFLNSPKYEVVPTLKRYALRKQIEEARKRGKDTTYLKAALDYVDVEEAIYRAEEGAFTLDI